MKNRNNFVPHKNVPGPARLHMEKADISGTVNKDPEWIADRLAILNHLTAYSYLIDEGRYDDWFALFSDDIVFETTTPVIGTARTKGKEAFKAVIFERYIKGEAGRKAMRRHTQGNIHVSEQTPTTAKARTYMLISTVPLADKLSVLTTGTYNAELAKRNGKWTITRWYIEADAPLAPSKVTPGVEWTPDPLTVIPGAVPGPLAGQVSLKNFGWAMPTGGPLMKLAPMWSWDGMDAVIVDYLTDAKSAAALLPEGVTTLPIPELPGFSAVKHVWANYRDSSFGPYKELIVAIPCLFKGEMYLYVPFIYVTNDAALAAGREMGGWPKKIADIRMERAGNDWRLSFSRNGAELNATVKVGYKLFSTPLSADKPVSLPYPQNMTLPLPAPTGKPQGTVPFPTLQLKVIPGVGAENPPPVVAQLIGAPWKMSGDFYGTEGVTIAMHPTKDDPFDKLPILTVVGGTYASGKMTLALEEMKVLADWLKK